MATDGHRNGVVNVVLKELGLTSLYTSGRNVHILCVQRFVRFFAYGASTLILVSLLQQLSISPTRVGLFMMLTLAGDVVISFILALFADRLGRRAVLILGAVLMAGSGVVFATQSIYWVLLAAAVFGVISPGGNEIGPFRAVEESTIAHLTQEHDRASVYAWYSLFGSAGAAFGIMTCGWATDVIYRKGDISLLETYRLAFYAYAILGLMKASLVFLMSSAVEIEAAPKTDRVTETDPLIRREASDENEPEPEPSKRRWLPKFSKQGGASIVTLCLLLGLDSFASGLAPLSWLTYFFKSHYTIPEGKLGSILFRTSIISAASALVASSLARRFGNVKGSSPAPILFPQLTAFGLWCSLISHRRFCSLSSHFPMKCTYPYCFLFYALAHNLWTLARGPRSWLRSCKRRKEPALWG